MPSKPTLAVITLTVVWFVCFAVQAAHGHLKPNKHYVSSQESPISTASPVPVATMSHVVSTEVLVEAASATVAPAAAADPAATNDVEWKVDLSNPRTVLGLVLSSFFVMVAAGGGIGGGGILVPTYIFVLGFSAKVAIPLSTVTILGSSIVNCILNVRKRHPFADRPLIDWDLMLVMEPLTIAGTVIGSFANVLCPPWLLCVMLVLLLGMTTVKTFKKGVKMYRKETADRLVGTESNQEQLLAQKDAAHARARAHIFGNDIYAPAPGDDGVDAIEIQQHVVDSRGSTAALDKVRAGEMYHSRNKILALLGLTCGVLTLTILKGGHSVNPLSIECGQFSYWLISMAVVPFVLVISYYARRYLVRMFHLKRELHYEYAPGDVEWDERNTIVYPLICSVAGLCAGLFGIGGGIVKGPLMLEMGVNAKVASATSATMILLTSSAAGVSYFLFNAMNLNFAPLLFSIGAVCTLVGQKLLNHLVKKYKRSSLIIFVIATTVAISTLAMSVQSSRSMVNLLEGHPDTPSALCG